jgi:hypothetical protein
VLESLAVRDGRAFADPDNTNAVVAALQHGRDRVTAWIAAPPAHGALVTALRAAAVGERRANLLAWQFAASPERAAAALTPTEIFQLGSETDLPAAWGAGGPAIDGCVCTVAIGQRSREGDRGRVGLVAAVQTDLPLRIAEHLAALRLPLLLVPALMPAAVQDWLNHVSQFSPIDLDALSVWPTRLPSLRIEDYLLALVADGTLASRAGREVPR